MKVIGMKSDQGKPFQQGVSEPAAGPIRAEHRELARALNALVATQQEFEVPGGTAAVEARVWVTNVNRMNGTVD